MTIYEATVSHEEGGQLFRTMAATEALARQECATYLREAYDGDHEHDCTITVVEWLVVTEPYARPKVTKKKKAAKDDHVHIGVIYDNAATAPNTIRMYFHCRRCLEEFKAGIDHLGEPIPPMRPADYCRLNVGLTTGDGWQVWCARHEVNVTEFHLEDAVAELYRVTPGSEVQ